MGAKLPAEYRIIAAVALAIAAATARDFASAFAALGVGLVLTALERPPATLLLKAFTRLNTFFLLLFCTLPLGFGPPVGPALALGPVHFTLQGVMAATVMLIKANAVTLIFIALPGRLGARENCRALRNLGFPDKLVTLLLLMGGYIGLFARELEALRSAAKLRGFAPSFSLHTVRTSASLAAMLFIRAWDKSARMDRAMRLRGFDGRFVLYGERVPAGPAALALTGACLLAALAIPAVGLYVGPL
jgi:cobalt/nickel transport system permease protein